MAEQVVTCVFCRGRGKDPFGLLSKFSRCQVCGGKGSVTIREPAVRCAFCGGSGIHRDQRLTCTACGGRGMVRVWEPTETCPRCRGFAADPAINYLPCVSCNGTGVVTVRVMAAA